MSKPSSNLSSGPLTEAGCGFQHHLRRHIPQRQEHRGRLHPRLHDRCPTAPVSPCPATVRSSFSVVSEKSGMAVLLSLVTANLERLPSKVDHLKQT